MDTCPKRRELDQDASQYTKTASAQAHEQTAEVEPFSPVVGEHLCSGYEHMVIVMPPWIATPVP